MSLPKLLTSPEVQKALHISKPTLYRLIGAGEIPATKVGGHLRIDQADVEAYLHRNRVAVSQ